MLQRSPLRPPKPLSRAARRREQHRRAQARWRTNVQTCAAIYPLRLDATDLNWLVTDVRYLGGADGVVAAPARARSAMTARPCTLMAIAVIPTTW
jgi:hypothetical protein